MTTEQLHEHILQIKKDLDEKEARIAEMKDRLVRTLADMENLREQDRQAAGRGQKVRDARSGEEFGRCRG